MSDFVALGDAVWMIGRHAPWRMSDHAVDVMLDLFEDAGEHSRFNDLYEAQKAAMGDLHIPRVTSIRRSPVLVVDNAPDVAAHNFNRTYEASL
jgi:hypothetical protein